MVPAGRCSAYLVDRFDLRGHGYHLERSRHTYTEALVLDAAQLTVPTTDYAAKRWVHPVTARTRYNVRETTVVCLAGTNPRNPQFRYAGATGTAYDGAFVLSHPFNAVLGTANRSVTLDVPFDYHLSDAPSCRSGQIDQDSSVAHAPVPGSCSRTRSPALIFVRGAARGSGHGELDLRIEGAHIINSDFGGQEFDIMASSWQSLNFLPRGVKRDSFAEALGSAIELNEYSDRVVLEPGELVRVTVSIVFRPPFCPQYHREFIHIPSFGASTNRQGNPGSAPRFWLRDSPSGGTWQLVILLK